MQSCVIGFYQHAFGEIGTKLSSPRFRPRLACHEAHGIEGAIAVAHGVHNQGADRSVVPDNANIFNDPPVFADATIVAALIMVAWARVARHVVVRCDNVGGLNNAAHFNEPSFLVPHRPGEERIAQGLPNTKQAESMVRNQAEIYAF